jgi:hypothetical protein
MTKRTFPDMNREADVIRWALPHIAEHHYYFVDDPKEPHLVIDAGEPTFEEMEGFLQYRRADSQLLSLRRLRERFSIENILDAATAYLGARLGFELAQQLQDGDYELSVAGIYLQEQALIRSIQKVIVSAREGLSPENLAKIEAGALPEAVEAANLGYYAAEIANLFPRLVKRASQVPLALSRLHVPPGVQQYVIEASKCFIYGRFLACLVVCRTALEVGYKDLILRRGKQMEFARFASSEGEGELARMIRFVKATLADFPSERCVDADEVRVSANRVAHGSPVSPEDCRGLFQRTRGVLEALYS